jgi:hypothetical protein
MTRAYGWRSGSERRPRAAFARGVNKSVMGTVPSPGRWRGALIDADGGKWVKHMPESAGESAERFGPLDDT